MSIFIQTPEVYAVDGANIFVQGVPTLSKINPTVNDTGPLGAQILNTATNTLWTLVNNTYPNLWVDIAAANQFNGLTDTTNAVPGAIPQIAGPALGYIQIKGDEDTGIRVVKDTAYSLTVSNLNRTDARVVTTDATPTELVSYTMPENSSVTVVATVMATKSDWTNSYGTVITRTFRRVGAAAPVAVAATIIMSSCSDAPGTVQAELEVNGATDIRLEVIGEALTTYNWVGTFETIIIPAA